MRRRLGTAHGSPTDARGDADTEGRRHQSAEIQRLRLLVQRAADWWGDDAAGRGVHADLVAEIRGWRTSSPMTMKQPKEPKIEALERDFADADARLTEVVCNYARGWVTGRAVLGAALRVARSLDAVARAEAGVPPRKEDLRS